METVLHVITGLGLGGAESQLFHFVTSDTSRKHHVVSLMHEGVFGPRLKEQDIAVTCLHMPAGKISFAGMRQLYRLVRSMRPDYVQTWMYHADLVGGLMAQLAGARNIFWGLHNTHVDPSRTAWRTRFVVRLCALFSGFVPRRILSCSSAGVDVHAALGYRRDKLVVAHNGYDFEAFKPDEAARQQLRQQWGIGDDTVLLGTVGRYHPQKDHENLLQALAKVGDGLGDWRCVFAGTGLSADNPWLMPSVEKYGLAEKVILLGPRPDIPDIMNAMDINVLPSAFGEAFPNVLVEAMATGVPCVTTDVGDSAVIVDEYGIVVPPSDADALATAIGQMASQKQDAAAWSSRKASCRNFVTSRFSQEAMIQRYASVWAGDIQHG